MRRILSLMIAAVMLTLCIVGCGKRDPKYIGKWEADSMNLGGESSTAVMGVPLSALFRFEVTDDGKVKWRSAVDNNIIQNAKSNMDITWKETEKNRIEFKVTDISGKEATQTMNLNYRDDMLVIEEGGSAIYLKKVDEFTQIDPALLNSAASAIQNFGINN
ncbi:MAG: hypothetical protein K6G33_03480 [Ruminococcus sp.]|uniref:hypothetical protein n=1 Tax=Ruminococcus sp. TaxID=41978 RepID=UPI0025E2949C|nr:hypothetical protein [Ruminococcus sp.]MCR5599792.1 hypothetical protein [Ruminococcus sp.]